MQTKALKFLIVLTAALALTLALKAQTPPLPSGTNTVEIVQGIGTTLGDWFTSENPTNRYQDVLTWAGVINQNGAPVANETGGSWDLWRQNKDYYPFISGTNQSSSTLFLGPEVRGRFSSPGIVSGQAGPEFGWMENDIRLGAAVDFVHRFSTLGSRSSAKERWELDFFADKMVSKNTAVGFMLGFQAHEPIPLFGGQMNISFGNGKGLFGIF
jgi:hypothetical protein